MTDETVDALITLGRKLRNQVDLEKVEEQLKNLDPDDVDDRLDSALFSMSHLFYSGAVAEYQIENAIRFQRLPKAITKRRAFMGCDEVATLRAWEGTSYGGRYNIIGSLAFLVSILFFFESFTKLVIGQCIEKPPSKAGKLVAWLRANTEISPESLDAVHFLNQYRNAWHELGVHAKWAKSVSWRGLTLSPGKYVPVVTRDQSVDLLKELVAVTIEVNRLRL